MKMRRAKAFVMGIGDGWRQPYTLSTSWNVDHLWRANSRRQDDVYEWLDRGINIGQLLRAGRRSQAWRERYWPLPQRKRKT